MPELSPVVSHELVQALADAGLIDRCPRCVAQRGLCEECLPKVGPRLSQPTFWLRIMGERSHDGCPSCGSDLQVQTRKEDASWWFACTYCDHTTKIETLAERRAREKYEAKARKRAEALERQTAGRRATRRDELQRAKIPIKRVA